MSSRGWAQPDRRRLETLETARPPTAGRYRIGAACIGTSLKTAGNNRPAGMVSRLYVGYIRIQHHLMDWFLPAPVGDGQAAALRPEDGTMIRLWSFLGPTTNRSALIAFALIGRVDLFLWAVIVPGNLWLAAVWYLQRRVDGRSTARIPEIPS